MTYDFFHTEPYLSMAIESRDDIETTVLLLVAGLLVGTIASKGRSARHRETATRFEVRRVHRVAEAAATGRPPMRCSTSPKTRSRPSSTLPDAGSSLCPTPTIRAQPRLGRNDAIHAQSS